MFVAVSAQTLSVEVRDDGSGIAPADMARLFCRHHTAHAPATHAGATLCNLAALARRVTVTSRTPAARTTYTRTAHTGPAAGETPVTRAPVARSPGTTVAVAALYHALPVRRAAAAPALVLARTRAAVAAAAVLAPRTALTLVDTDAGTALLRLAPCAAPLARYCALHGVDPAAMVALPPAHSTAPSTLAWRGWVAAPARAAGHHDRRHQLLCECPHPLLPSAALLALSLTCLWSCVCVRAQF